ncbi:MAG: response regulator [Pseudobdellovibrionaceae bacterium]
MRILILDRDEAATTQISARLKTMGHEVEMRKTRDDAQDFLAQNPCPLVFIDPAPMKDGRLPIQGLRQSAQSYPYVVLMGDADSASAEEGAYLKAGANVFLKKPVDLQELEKVTNEACDFLNLKARLASRETDFPSGGGVIAKSAFNELFLSCLDRGERHGEEIFCLFIGMGNYRNLLIDGGDYVARSSAARLAKELTRIRRQSDILAQTDDAEFAILLLRSDGISEPIDAANRFVTTLSVKDDEPLAYQPGPTPEVTVKLMAFPSGTIHFEKTFAI